MGKWDTTVAAVQKSTADVHRPELLKAARGAVLEVGVGTGRCFQALQQSGQVDSFVGVDIVEEMLDVARPKLPALPFPAQVVKGDAHRLPFPDASIDTVVGSLCLCSVEDPKDALCEMARVCRDDGQVLLVEPGLADWLPIRASQRYLGLVPDPKHAWEFGWYDDLDFKELFSECSAL